MTWSWRTSRMAIVGYLLVAVLVIGGLTWATVVSVRLEQNRAAEARQTEFRRIMAQAIARMDERVASFMIRESRRPVLDYEPFSSPDDIWLTDPDDPWVPLDQTEVAKRSELATTKFPEPWLLFHFSVSAMTDWSSPQIPTPDWFMVPDGHGKILYPIPEPSQRVLQVFSQMRRGYTPEPLGDLIAEARAANPLVNDEDPEQVEALTSLSSTTSQRLLRAQSILRESRAPEICDARDLAQLLFSGDDGEDESSAKEDVLSCVTSDFTGLWIPLEDGQDPVLAFVRTVVVADGRSAYQGFVLDWPVLREALPDEVSGFLPEAQLEPVFDHTDTDLETHMSWMPVRLVASPDAVSVPRTSGLAGLRSGLVLIWIAALTVLGAVGLGVHALLDLAERRRQFAYAVSHELRTPLTTFRLYTDMLATGMTPPEKREEYLQTLNEESQRLADLVGGVLEYSRLEAQAPNLAVDAVTASELMDAVCERFGPLCKQHDRPLLIKTFDTDGIVIRTDPDLVMQILGILIDNACKYATDADNPLIGITAAAIGADKLALEVRDFGPGIARNNRRRIFEPFRRGVGGSQFGGIGLGLALARRWAGLIGGKLTLLPADANDPGARFRLTLPVARDA